MLIGLTGGIGSGKSLAGDFFKSKNIDVVDADDLAHHALDRDCLLYTSPSPRDRIRSRMPSSA